ncbi:MAG TPA: peptidoglycan DD-metalloendopeptidase family protein [Mycobacteriales bacterium]|nr:peptidoglycan DD-metalloendopeptidase family protein [Mycobacteriales bacterium]
MSRRALLVLAVVAGLLLTLAPDAPAASSKTLKAQLTEAVGRQQAAQARDAKLAEDILKLQRRLVADEKALAAVRGRLSQRARLVYMAGLGGAGLEVMVTADDPDAALERISLLNAATRADRSALDRSRSVRRRVEATRRSLVLARRESAKALATMRTEGARITRLLRSAEASESMEALNSRKEALNARNAALAARRPKRATRSGGSLRMSGNYACLVGSNHAFRDTWGAPRSGGRRHKGVDVFAPMGSPSYAVTDGVISNIHAGGNGGKMLYLRGDDGNEYFYSHMSSYASKEGDRVRAGEIIAYVGDTGNARGGSPHVHFEVHPGGGAPINPTPFTHRVCG